MAATSLSTCTNLLKNKTNLLLYRSYLWRHFCTSLEAAEKLPKIVIPARIPRGPTDILKALASTLKIDPTAPQYKYYDDPYLIPTSHIAKRSYALSKESGRKAARYFLETYPDQFENNPAQPFINAFVATEKLTESSNISEDDLTVLIYDSQVENSIQAYKNLVQNGVTLSEKTTQALLELVCFYNSTEAPEQDYLEEKWYKQDSKIKNTWKSDGFAVELFDSLESKTPAAYNAYLLGLLKHTAISQAHTLYKTMTELQIPVTLEAYNGLIANAYYIQDGSETRWQMVVDFLTEMNELKVLPDVNTFNAALEVLSHSGRWTEARRNALRVMKEMKRLSIDPSLASFYYLLIVFYKEKSTLPSPLINSVMDLVEHKEWTFKNRKDTFFFPTMMELCNTIFHDNKLGHRIHTTFLNNTHMINNSMSENIYFQHFFKLLVTTEDIDEFFTIYNIYVPNRYTPEPGVLIEIIKQINLGSGHRHLTKIWNDICMFGLAHVSRIITPLIEAVAQETLDAKDQDTMLELAWSIKEKVEELQQIAESHNRSDAIYFTGQEWSDFLKVATLCKDIPKCEEIMKEIQKEPQNASALKESAIISYCTLLLDSNLPKELLKALNYLGEYSHMPNLWIKLKSLLADSQLTPEYKSQVEHLCKGSSSIVEEIQ